MEVRAEGETFRLYEIYTLVSAVHNISRVANLLLIETLKLRQAEVGTCNDVHK
jgi:hypothetical protein